MKKKGRKPKKKKKKEKKKGGRKGGRNKGGEKKKGKKGGGKKRGGRGGKKKVVRSRGRLAMPYIKKPCACFALINRTREAKGKRERSPIIKFGVDFFRTKPNGIGRNKKISAERPHSTLMKAKNAIGSRPGSS